MYLTKKRSVKLSRHLWNYLANTGKFKEDWHGWADYGTSVLNKCFMCEYSTRQCKRRHMSPSCDFCPYYLHYHIACMNVGSSFNAWSRHCLDTDVSYRKLYALEFLHELEGIVV